MWGLQAVIGIKQWNWIWGSVWHGKRWQQFVLNPVLSDEIGQLGSCHP